MANDFNLYMLEQMANEGKVPALLIDGKWRFARTAVDEWLNLQGQQRLEA